MFSSTAENALVLSLFQFLFAGLVLFVLCTVLIRNPRARSRRDIWALAASFLLLSGHLLLTTLEHYFDIMQPQIGRRAVHSMAELLEAAAFLLLAAAYTVWGRKVRG